MAPHAATLPLTEEGSLDEKDVAKSSASITSNLSAADLQNVAAASLVDSDFVPYFQRVSISGDDNTGVCIYLISSMILNMH